MKSKVNAFGGLTKHFKRFFTVVFTCALCLELSGCYLFPKEKEVIAPPLVKPVDVTYDTIDAEKGEIKVEVNSTGNFVYIHQQELSFTDRGGRLKKLYVKNGDHVTKGRLLAELDTDDLKNEIEQQKIVLKKAETSCQSTIANGKNEVKLEAFNLSSLKNDLESLKDDLESFKNGLSGLEDDLGSLKHEYDNMTSGSSGVNTNEIYSQKEIEAAERNIKEQERKIKEQEIKIKEQQRNIKEQGAKITDQQRKIDDLKEQYGKNGTAIKQAEADIEMQELKLKQLQLQFQKAKLVSPISGIIMDVDSTIVVGDDVKMNAPFITIADENALQLSITESEDVPKFVFGMTVNVADTYGNSYKGKVIKTPGNMLAEEKLKAGDDANCVQIEVIGLKKEVKAGDTADANIVLKQKKDVIVIPKDVVHDYNGQKVVDVLEKGHKREKIIEIGIETESEYEVVKGIAAGDKIIKS